MGDTLSLDAKGTNGSGANIVISELLGKDVDTVEIGVSTFINTTLRLNKREITGVTTEPHDILDGETISISGINTSQFTEFNGLRKVSVVSRSVGLTTYLNNVTNTGVSTHIFVTDTRGFSPSDTIGIGTEKFIVTGIDLSLIHI